MVRYAFDLYPRTDPRDGTVIRRFEHLQEAAYKAEENGTGSGQIVVAGDSADGEDIDPRGLQYVRVLEIDDSDVETVKGGFWLEQGKFQALTRKETKHLEFGGAGTLAYLQREVMWSRSYINEVMPGFIGQDPIGTTWNLAAQSTIYANGNHLGAMLWRVIQEGLISPSGNYTHRHFDGVDHTGTHAGDDKPESAIPDLVMTFDQNDDSDGNPWTLTAGTFTAQVGESLLSVTRRLMEMGLKVEMDPDTFELNAWEAPHRTDRTSATWASGKVLFTAPTAEDIDTGNILSDTIRTVRPYIQRSAVLAGSENVYAVDTGSADVPWHGGYRIDTEDTATAEDVAERQRLARADATDNLKVVMKLGNAPLQGRYRPWVHVNPGDLVTVDTGSDQWEFNNITFPVAALTVELKQGGDWRAIAELGSSFTSLLEPAFMVGGAPAHTHPPNPRLCTTQLETGETATLYEEWTWDSLPQTVAHPGDLSIGPGTNVWGQDPAAGPDHPAGTGAEATSGYHALEHDAGSNDVAATAGTVYRFTGFFWEYNNDVRFEVRWLTSAGALLGTDLLAHNAAWAAAWTPWTSADYTAPTGTTNLQVRARTGASGGVGATGWIDQIRIYTIAAGVTEGGVTDEYTGSSEMAARCDHGHDHNDLFNRNAINAHAASAVTYDPTETGLTAENVQDAIDELIAGGDTLLRWEAVTNGEDVFVWEGDDLVHEFKDYS